MAERHWAVIFGWGILLMGISFGSLVFADSTEKDSSVRRYGVAWNVAEDRKMENINGVYQPEDLDKYMKRYFEQLFSKVNELSVKMDRLSGQVAQLETQIKGLSKKNEASASIPHARLI